MSKVTEHAFDHAWRSVLADDRLCRARQKLSIHDLRLLISDAVAAAIETLVSKQDELPSKRLAAEEFVHEMAELGVPLPWNVSENDGGVVVDADGVPLLVVDEGGELPDGLVLKIAAMVMLCVNTCGGFKAELQ